MIASTRPRLVEALDRMMQATSQDELVSIIAELDPADRSTLLEAFSKHLPAEQLKELNAIAEQVAQEWRPQTPDELWKFLRDECGLRVPRKAVCPGHTAPMELATAVYFETGNADKLAIGNRGSGKTNIMGAVHYANGRTKPKHEGATAGSVKSQAEKCRAYLRSITDEHPDSVKSDAMQKVVFTNLAIVEVITGTLTGVNSPHPQLAHFDEIELFRPGVLDEGEHMSQSKHGYRALDVKTTSWKKVRGPVSEIIESVRAALREGEDPPVEIHHWCVWETTEPCAADCDACPFANVRKGEWSDGSPRTFESACKRDSPEPGVGKLKFSDGFVTIEDSVRRFRKMSKRNWESQQESRRPQAEGLIYDNFDEDLHSVDFWVPDPIYGPVDVGLDFGGTDPHAATFWQHLNVAVTVELIGGRRVTIPAGADVQFDEVYQADVGNVTFGRLINEKVEAWETMLPGFRHNIKGFYRDPAARAAALDLVTLSQHGPPGDPAYRDIRSAFIGHVQISLGIALIYERIDQGLVYIDRMRCTNTIDEFGSYEYNPRTGEPVDADNHTLDANRYRFWNRHRRGDVQSDSPTGGGAAYREYDHTVNRGTDGDWHWNPAKLGGAGSIIAVHNRKPFNPMP